MSRAASNLRHVVVKPIHPCQVQECSGGTEASRIEDSFTLPRGIKGSTKRAPLVLHESQGKLSDAFCLVPNQHSSRSEVSVQQCDENTTRKESEGGAAHFVVQELVAELETERSLVNKVNEHVGDGGWMLELKEKLLLALERVEAERSSTDKRLEEFARKSHADKKELQSRLDSTQQLLTHVKLSLTESQRKVEELETLQESKCNSFEATSPPMLEEALQESRATIESLRLKLVDAETKERETRRRAESQRLESDGKHDEIRRHLKSQLEDQRKELDRLAKEHESLSDSHQGANGKLEDLKEVLNTERLMHQKALEIRDARLQVEEKEAKRREASLKSKMATMEQRHIKAIADLEASLSRALAESATHGAKSQHSERILEETERKLRALTRRIDEEQNLSLKLKDEIQQKDQAMERISRDLAKQKESFACSAENLEAQISTLGAQVAVLEQKLHASAQEVVEKQSCVDRLTLELRQVKERLVVQFADERLLFEKRLQEVREDAQLELNRAKQVNEDLTNVNATQTTKVQELSNDLHLLQQQYANKVQFDAATSLRLREAEKKSRTLSSDLNTKESRIEELTAELVDTKREHSLTFKTCSERLGRTKEELDRLFKAHSAIQSDLTCMECLEAFEDPVMVLPEGMRCCKKCVSTTDTDDTIILDDSVLDSLSGKCEYFGQVIGALKTRIDGILE